MRCLDCGKELTQTHLEPNQQNGLGGGDDPVLAARVARHRKDRAASASAEQESRIVCRVVQEGGRPPTDSGGDGARAGREKRRVRRYRAETEDMAKEIAEIEAERLRLEKETWLIRDAEVHFYDLDDMKRIYEIDRRHQRSFKEFGMQRQGVQWTDQEVAERVASIERGDYLEKEASPEKAGKEERKANIAEEDGDTVDDDNTKEFGLSPRSRRIATVDAEAFRLNATPSTPRVDEMRRRAAFHDMLQVVGRVNNYRQRLQELGAQKVSLEREREKTNDCLHFLHREVFGSEVHLKRIETDLTGAAKVLTVKRVADQQYPNGRRPKSPLVVLDMAPVWADSVALRGSPPRSPTTRETRSQTVFAGTGTRPKC